MFMFSMITWNLPYKIFIAVGLNLLENFYGHFIPNFLSTVIFTGLFPFLKPTGHSHYF
jgi:hypothetical protein